ncbi:MAG: DUF4317 domain-containing protein, partial [Dorea sp.]|nr:DUF4317 domain-containing protein [Dorea sp.]
REDMLELTRRMTPSRNHLVRLAGAYMDDEGYIDGTFNTSFLKLSGSEKNHCLEIAKSVPFSKTNEELKAYKLPKRKTGDIWQLLSAMISCELKNDGLMETFYEIFGERYETGKPYALYVFYGAYDVPVKAEDKYRFDESEEVYKYLIITISDVDQDYNADLPLAGMMYPAFRDRSVDFEHVNVFKKEGYRGQGMKQVFGI